MAVAPGRRTAACGNRWASASAAPPPRVRGQPTRTSGRRRPRLDHEPGRAAAPGRWRGCARSGAGSPSPVPVAQHRDRTLSARTTAVCGEVLGVGVAAGERAREAEDLGAVLDHDLPQVDGVDRLLSLAASAHASTIRSDHPAGPRERRYRTFRPPGWRMGARAYARTPWPASSSPAALPDGGLDPARRGRARACCNGRVTSPTRPTRTGGRRRRRRRDRVRAHRPDRRGSCSEQARRGCGWSPTSRSATTTSTWRRPPSSASRCATRPACSTRPRPTSRSSSCWRRPAERRTPKPTSGTAGGPGFHIGDFLGVDVHGRDARVVGFGRIGQAVARRAAGFGMEVLHHTRRDTGLPGWVADLDDLLPRVDIVSLHVPPRRRDPGLIDARRLALMKPDRGAGEHRARPGRRRGGARRSRSRRARSSARASTSTHASPRCTRGCLAAPHTVLLPHIGSATEAHAAAHGAARVRRRGQRCSPASGHRTW